MVMIMSTYRYNYLRVRQKKNHPSTVRNDLRGPAFVALPRPFTPSSSDELVETSLCNGFGTNDLSAAYSCTIPTVYSDEACLCVTDLRRGTTLSKGTLSILYSKCMPLFFFVVGLSYCLRERIRFMPKRRQDDKWSPIIIAKILARMYESFETELSLENAKR